MAPRSTKTKKTAENKVIDIEVPKKSRGKNKSVEETDNNLEVLIEDINVKTATAADKKPKRGKKVFESNGLEVNGSAEASSVPAKKSKKKIVSDQGDTKNGHISPIVDSPVYEPEKNLDGDGDNEIIEDVENVDTVVNDKGKKKATKKNAAPKAAVEEKPEKPSRGKKTKAEVKETPEEIDVPEKTKPAAKGRGRKISAKVEKESEPKTENVEEEVKSAPASKGRKKAQPKATIVKEKTPVPETHDNVDEVKEDIEDPKEVSKIIETKGRKKLSKKDKSQEDAANKESGDTEPAVKKRKTTKKDEKGDSKEEEAIVEPKAVTTKAKKEQKKAVVPVEAPEEPNEAEDTEPATKRRRKPTDEKAPAEEKKKAPLKNKAATDYESIEFSNTSKNTQGKEWNLKIASWNVDGIRAWWGKGGLDYVKYEKPDILCLQEVKCSKEKLPEEVANPPGYHAYWLCSDQDGYAGVGIYTTKLAMNVQYGLNNEELDSEGRIITAEYEQFYLICTYVPNAGRKLVTLPKRLQWNKEFRKYVKELDKKKPVIICGDMNVAHNEIDLANPKNNKKNAGFTAEERAGMTELLGDGFVDTYRHLNPDETGAYTFWTYMMNSRAKNVGWRLDYFIVSERLLPSICDSVIRDGIYGSDHCPISLFLHLTTADKPKE